MSLAHGALLGDLAHNIRLGDVAIEGFTCLLIFKNVFTYAIATQGVPWLLQSGPEHIFIIIGIVQACVASLALPMCKLPRLTLMVESGFLTCRRSLWQTESSPYGER